VNYYSAKQRKDGKWDYTCQNDNFIYPVGYCHLPDVTNEVYNLFPEDVKCITENSDKFHECGHETQEEAEECYKQYILDFQLRLKTEDKNTQRKCQVCGEWTTLLAIVDTKMFQLCDEHNNRDEVEKLYGKVGMIWTS